MPSWKGGRAGKRSMALVEPGEEAELQPLPGKQKSGSSLTFNGKEATYDASNAMVTSARP